MSFRDLVTALRTYTPEQLGLKRRFALVFLRWVGTIGAAYLPFTYLFGQYAPFVLIVVYIGLTIVAEIMPDRFIAAFGDPDPRRRRYRDHRGGGTGASRAHRAPPRATRIRRARRARRRSSRRG